MGVREVKMGGEDLMGKYNSKATRPRANPNLSSICLNITDDILDALTYGESRGWWATRSEGARIVMHRGLNIIFQEKFVMNEEIDKVIETNLDPKKKYVNIPGKGYIEIIGEA